MALSLTREQKKLRAQIAANSRWSKEDPKEGTKPARAAFERRFELEVDPDGTLPELERKRRATAREACPHAALGSGVLAGSVEGGNMIRLSNTDDLREDLELVVMELQDRFGVAPSSIRRYVNSAIRAKEDPDGIRAAKFLRQRWARVHEPSEDPSHPIGNARRSPQAALGPISG